MNLLLLETHEIDSMQRVFLDGPRLNHLLQIPDIAPGREIKMGLVDGKLGTGRVTELSGSHAVLEADINKPPPEPLPLTLIIALPRPKMLKRIVQTIATMGVKELIFINSYRVEKSYWQTPLLQPEHLRQHLILGLEQGIDTIVPEVRLVKRFKPFVEDELPGICRGKRALVAHPQSSSPCPSASGQESVLLIGPEGGFIDYEIDKLSAAGCSSFHLGRRILRVETAVPVLLAKLFSF